MEDKEVLLILPKLGREFCYILKKEIMTPVMRQNINVAKNDAEALFHIREVSKLVSHHFIKKIHKNYQTEYFYQVIMRQL